ncbi:esterase-like activity of phytase family protein [Roseinatronobacter sp. NSM]|uniref:esterase-like activity of phytase family protein n=1 Tax=Roseinatronobacter sp. NSM TaxID=3457785 RepID=UPI00403503F9
MMTRRATFGLLGAPALLGACQITAVHGDPSAANFGPTAFHGRFVWTHSSPRFGGFSGLHLAENGRDFWALSDRGTLWQGRFTRGADDAITRVDVAQIHVLKGRDAAPLPRSGADAEAIALGRDGTVFIAFEGGAQARISAYAMPSRAGRDLPRHRDFSAFAANQSLEALAIDPAGRLHTLPEAPQADGFAVFRLDGGAWSVIGHIPQRGEFMVVGADFGPDGNFYLLERQFRRALFSTRISRIQPGNWASVQTLLQTQRGQFDNHEGISVTRTQAGRLRATLISDDNFNWFQRTEILEFLLP